MKKKKEPIWAGPSAISVWASPLHSGHIKRGKPEAPSFWPPAETIQTPLAGILVGGSPGLERIGC